MADEDKTSVLGFFPQYPKCVRVPLIIALYLGCCASKPPPEELEPEPVPEPVPSVQFETVPLASEPSAPAPRPAEEPFVVDESMLGDGKYPCLERQFAKRKEKREQEIAAERCRRKKETSAKVADEQEGDEPPADENEE